ncbi:8-oxo-dGTP diphosphatase MutT [Leeia sp. TBRC 13508]|uniref:8-oxo-dGTP diphosphatase n=1 Tax=Leeia speluncae TaxID=2884804 RepID=A0ABS8D620_9NEIS|nr:8-oxo-dGTP diphosphatase MutT [Leeia speluncae]MCB6183634.1 8-oxo-dGTP diphosphatase MutT [Leeia speluncae]
MTKRFVHVAAGVLIRPNGEFLLASRPEGKPMAGYWEFPGGKIEAGETPEHALVRELQEELGIEVKTAYPWVVQSFDYTHAKVRLHFFRITEWEGEVESKESQHFAWQHVNEVTVSPVLPANQDILRWLGLPERIQVKKEVLIPNAQGDLIHLTSVFAKLSHASNVQAIKDKIQLGADALLWSGLALPAATGEDSLLEQGFVPIYLPAELVGGNLTLAMSLGAHGIYDAV